MTLPAGDDAAQGSYHVLATAYDDHSLYNGRARQPTPGQAFISRC
jgi:hypothetical protein